MYEDTALILFDWFLAKDHGLPWSISMQMLFPCVQPWPALSQPAPLSHSLVTLILVLYIPSGTSRQNLFFSQKTSIFSQLFLFPFFKAHMGKGEINVA